MSAVTDTRVIDEVVHPAMDGRAHNLEQARLFARLETLARDSIIERAASRSAPGIINLLVLLGSCTVAAVISTAIISWLLRVWWDRHDRRTAERMRVLAARRDALEKLYNLPTVEPRR